MVRGSGAAADQRELAAVHHRSKNCVGAASNRDVRHLARWDNHQYSGYEVERQSVGGYVGSARDTGVEPARPFASGIQRIESERRVLVRFSQVVASCSGADLFLRIAIRDAKLR